jgi:hypothetical protein
LTKAIFVGGLLFALVASAANSSIYPDGWIDLSFNISERELGYDGATGRWLVEPGRFQFWLAKDSSSGQPADFELAK